MDTIARAIAESWWGEDEDYEPDSEGSHTKKKNSDFYNSTRAQKPISVIYQEVVKGEEVPEDK